METDTFKNCSGFTDEQITAVALARSITAGICGAILLLVLVVLVILAIRPKSRDRVCGSVKKRLTIWLTAVTVLAELFQSLSLIYYFNPHNMAFCVADGFLTQYFGFVQLLFTLWLILKFFFKVSKATKSNVHVTIDEEAMCCGYKKKMVLEVGLCFVTFIVSLLTAIPFAYSVYGPIGPWCWIRSLEAQEGCSDDTVGHIIQLVIWNVPYGLVIILILVLFIAALSLLRRVKKTCKLGVINSIVIFVFLVITFTMCILELGTCDVSLVEYVYAAWIVYAVSTPLGQLAIPLALLVAVYLPLLCKRHKGRKSRGPQTDIVTSPDSDRNSQPSDTVFVPKHEPTDTTWQSPYSDKTEEERGERTPLFDDYEK